ncbi:MAG: hypothetical protein DRG83_21275 [Deltaproteobacteria bacterium]|nr:MAG: hypothetical protein DRG83_21275 [Deltaproteobacteria bacterium]
MKTTSNKISGSEGGGKKHKRTIIVGFISLCLSLVVATYIESFIKPGIIMLFNAIKGKSFTLTLPAGSSIVRAVGAD